jgi:phasin
MTDPQMKMVVPEQVRELGVKSVDQAEAAFTSFMESASMSVTLVPGPMSGLAKQALELTDKNLKASFDLAKQLMQAKDINEVMNLQSDFLRNLYSSATDHFKQMTGGLMAAAQNRVKGNPEGT